MKIILASASPRRAQLLRQAGINDFEICPSDVDENLTGEFAPPDMVHELSRRKAVAAKADADDIVIAADTLVFLSGQALSKPVDRDDAERMLTLLSGARHTVMTGVTVRRDDALITRHRETDVWFRALTPEEISAYIDTGEPMDKAGAYGVQGKGALLVERIDGDFFNVMGLPLRLLSSMLIQVGIHLL